MPTAAVKHAPALVGLAIALTFGLSAFAQGANDPDATSREASPSPPNERLVPAGKTTLELPQGAPIPAFAEGGAKEAAFDAFMEEQMVAGFIVVHDGKIRMERYARGHGPAKRWTSLSVAKSVTSTLVAVAIAEGHINSIDDHVTAYLPELRGSAFDSVTIRHLLTMTSGVKWNEHYTGPDSDIAAFDSDTIVEDMKAIVSYMRRQPAVAKPGERYNYSTGETHLLGAVVSAATGTTLSDYLTTRIWQPFGMEDTATWRLDRTGQELAGCCLQMRLRDFARFGEFVREDGSIDGGSIVTEGWFKEATRIQKALWPGGGYGYGWWIFNSHSFEALGIHGQKIYVDPSRKLVIAINSEWPEADSNTRHFAVAGFIQSIATEIDKE